MKLSIVLFAAAVLATGAYLPVIAPYRGWGAAGLPRRFRPGGARCDARGREPAAGAPEADQV
jgi:hypothetical protein